jgi:hypothetical protein
VRAQGAGPEMALGDTAESTGDVSTLSRRVVVASHKQDDRTLRGDRCRCRGCGAFFNSARAFDCHRAGSGIARHCLTSAEMQLRGMSTNAGGWWITRARSEQRRTISLYRRSGDLAAASPEVGTDAGGAA